MGLTATQKSLIEEARLSNNLEICDNIDLDAIYVEYSSYHHLKFGKYPKFIKKIDVIGEEKNKPKTKVNKSIKQQSSKISINQIPQTDPLEKSLQVSQINSSDGATQAAHMKDTAKITTDFLDNNFKLLNTNFDDYPDELHDLVKLVKADIITRNLNTNWHDIFGAEKAKAVLQEGLILPYEHPELFEGITAPWKSLLIYGPPGNGKTLIAKALSTETFGRLTFFNISPSSITSKWRGESEKLIRVNNIR